MDRFPEVVVGDVSGAQLVGEIGAEEIELDNGPEHELLERRRVEAPAGGRREPGAPPVEGLREVEGLGGGMDVEGVALPPHRASSPVVSSTHGSSPKVMHHSVASSSGSRSS